MDITTAAGAYITGRLDCSDADLIEIASADEQIFLPRNVVAMTRIAPKRAGEMSVQEAA